MVAFAPKRTSYPLLGFGGFLQFFRSEFDGNAEEFELTPNHLLPRQSPAQLQ